MLLNVAKIVLNAVKKYCVTKIDPKWKNIFLMCVDNKRNIEHEKS